MLQVRQRRRQGLGQAGVVGHDRGGAPVDQVGSRVGVEGRGARAHRVDVEGDAHPSTRGEVYVEREDRCGRGLLVGRSSDTGDDPARTRRDRDDRLVPVVAPRDLVVTTGLRGEERASREAGLDVVDRGAVTPQSHVERVRHLHAGPVDDRDGLGEAGPPDLAVLLDLDGGVGPDVTVPPCGAPELGDVAPRRVDDRCGGVGAQLDLEEGQHAPVVDEQPCPDGTEGAVPGAERRGVAVDADDQLVQPRLLGPGCGLRGGPRCALGADGVDHDTPFTGAGVTC